MDNKNIVHFMYCPWTGLGKYNGFRGNRWLKNRIKVFKQFVIPSLQAQTSKNFVLWCSWRPEEKNNPIVKGFIRWLNDITDVGGNNKTNHPSTYNGKTVDFKVIHTFHGVCFYDDKYEDAVARDRLATNLHGSIGELYEVLGDAKEVYMTIQPSDDLYDKHTVETLQWMFANEDWQAIGFKKGYIINYWTKEVAEYNPTTNPPFYTIKFPRAVFTDPLAHIQYTSMKRAVGKYPVGTPLPSHEYVGDCLKYTQIDERGFMVGTHLENISTTWQIPFKGESVDGSVLSDFGVADVAPVKMHVPARKRFYFSLPYKAQRKIRYWLTEKFKWKNPLKRFWFWRNYTTKQHADWWKNRKIDWKTQYLDTYNHPHRKAILYFLNQIKWNNLIEVGCGSGPNLVNIVNTFPGKYLAGVDVNKDALDLAKQVFIRTNPSLHFSQSPVDDILISDKNTEVLLSDMVYIYVGPRKIKKCIQEMKRLTRDYVLLCEFSHTNWFKRMWLFFTMGYHSYNWKSILKKNDFYDILEYRITKDDWPDSPLHQEFATIILAKVPKR